MKTIPIVEHLPATPPKDLRDAVERLQDTLRRERPDLALTGRFRNLVPSRWDDGPTLHLDDLSEIPHLDAGQDVRFYQDRARLRAGDGDLVATCGDPVAGYEAYCRDRLGLGAPQWLRPQPPRVSMHLAEACWEDTNIRKTLLDHLRRGKLRYVHPWMGTFPVWEIAHLLQRETNRPLTVLAAPPGVTRWVNDKIDFSSTVRRLFGPEFAPPTASAWNFATLSKRVKQMVESGSQQPSQGLRWERPCDAVGIKLPRAAGGDGNVVVPAEELRGMSLRRIRGTLEDRLRDLEWDGVSELLVDRWETNVLCSPAAQLWIPPESLGLPVVEGIFTQTTECQEGIFVGSVPAHLPDRLNQEIADRCWLLARLFQRLGYIGRCSFDMILVGESLQDCRIEFIECNGRWGGTSLPMTLMNRIFGDWKNQPHAVRVAHHIAGLERFEFTRLLDYFGEEVFDVRTGNGSLLFSNPGRLRYQSGITVIALASSWEEAAEKVTQMPERLRQFVQDQ